MAGTLTRRRFVLTTGGALLAARRLRGSAQTLTARAVADRIQGAIGVPWRATTTDGFKAGEPTTVVTGVAVATMPTLDVLRRAAATKHNLVVALGPTFYTPNDAPGTRASDPVYLAKREFLIAQRLAIFRMDDHWAARRPNEASTALAATLGWKDALVSGTEQVYRVPATTLGALARDVRNRLNARGGVRTVGQPGLEVRTVFVSAGATGVPGLLANLSQADVVLAGEPREWEAVPYVHDSWPAGTRKGMIAVGRIVSETPGMQACATWLRALIPEVPVTPVTVDDPYWNPAA